ncbi:MAG: SpoIIE family protein phosphatase [Clostridia bacterium]|nr:SpoIIE family protein phosphatase [Clostridia bacterium]MBQ8523891.1 SpoIIE family protein phosphatase [Clostridia bacterium]
MDKRTAITEGIRKASVRQMLRGLALFGGGALFACGSLPAGAAPFGVALACAARGKGASIAAAAGALMSSLFNGKFVFGCAAAAVPLMRAVLGLVLFGRDEERRTLRERTAESSVLGVIAGRLKKLSFDESVYARMMLASAVELLFGGVLLSGADYSIATVASIAAAGALSPVLVYLYEAVLFVKGHAERESALYRCGECAIAVSAVLGASSVLPFADLSIPCAFAVSILVTQRRGIFDGTLYGVVLNLATPTAAPPLYAVCALASAPLRRLAPAVSVAAGCIGGVAWALYFDGVSAMSDVVPKLIISSAILAPVCASGILPGPRTGSKESDIRADESMTLVVRDSEIRRRMNSLSEGLSKLSELLYRISDNLTAPDAEELCELCEASFDEYCTKCGMRTACFGREIRSTTEMQSKMILAMKRDGRVSAALVPRELASRCFNMGQIIDSMNAGCARMTAEAKLYDRTSVVAADYEVTSRLLAEAADAGVDGTRCDGELTERLRRALTRVSFKADRVGVFGGRLMRVVARGVDMKTTSAGAEDIRRCAANVCGMPMSQPEFSVDGSCVTMTLMSLPSLAVRCGRASVAMSAISGKHSREAQEDATREFSYDRRGLGKTSSADCGDVINAFLTDDSRFFMLISDGMGSGREAALTSGICAVFTEKLLRAGASMDTALKMLNSMMRSRGGECSATVDLMELDLMNGQVRFVKSGAAPSFVIRDGRLFRLQSKTVPIGIMRALDAEMISFEAGAGDTVVMLSDGVAKSFEDCPWLYDLLSGEKLRGTDPESMARTIVKCAVDNGAADDITAGVVIIEDAVSQG